MKGWKLVAIAVLASVVLVGCMEDGGEASQVRVEEEPMEPDERTTWTVEMSEAGLLHYSVRTHEGSFALCVMDAADASAYEAGQTVDCYRSHGPTSSRGFGGGAEVPAGPYAVGLTCTDSQDGCRISLHAYPEWADPDE